MQENGVEVNLVLFLGVGLFFFVCVAFGGQLLCDTFLFCKE